MMRLTAFAAAPNCTLEAPNYGTAAIRVETTGHGMQIVSDQSGARTQRTFYPFVRTSGEWYIEAVFSSVQERNSLHGWLLYYIIRATDQYAQAIPPITVTVPASEFMKTGYATSSIEFGDSKGIGVYRSLITFTSASDPLLIQRTRSPYVPPRRDRAALHFYPSGIQEKELPPPPALCVWSSGGSPYDEPGSATPTPDPIGEIRDWLDPFDGDD